MDVIKYVTIGGLNQFHTQSKYQTMKTPNWNGGKPPIYKRETSSNAKYDRYYDSERNQEGSDEKILEKHSLLNFVQSGTYKNYFYFKIWSIDQSNFWNKLWN